MTTKKDNALSNEARGRIQIQKSKEEAYKNTFAWYKEHNPHWFMVIVKRGPSFRILKLIEQHPQPNQRYSNIISIENVEYGCEWLLGTDISPHGKKVPIEYDCVEKAERAIDDLNGVVNFDNCEFVWPNSTIDFEVKVNKTGKNENED